ncbi:MAG: hypothetical protein OEV87_02595 [Phycisphaerae bacterium]|nr:hypothetical protein [Phycisphaerae bacterium]
MDQQEKEKKNRRILLFILGICSCFIVFLIIYLVMLWTFFHPPSQLSDEPGYISTTREFHQRMTESLDVIEVQDWLNTLNDSDTGEVLNQLYIATSFPIKLPNTINSLKREMSYIFVFRNDPNKTCVRMMWGGPIARWGVVIGPKGMPIPETVDVNYDEEGYRIIGEYRIKLEDGAYVWHEIK